MHRVSLKAIIMFLAITLLLVGCDLISPPTPEESCLKTSIELVKRNSVEEPDWPIKVTETSPITTDPVLCKGTAVFQDGETHYIQFYENSNKIAFEGYVTQTCQELAEQVILVGSTEFDWPVKLVDLKPIDSEIGERISCKSKAEFGDGEKAYTAIHQRSDDNEVGFKRYQSTTCQELAEQVILIGSTESGWPVKLENLIRIDEDPGERLTCKAHASYQDETLEARAVHEDIDGYVGFRLLPISERECDVVLMRAIMELTEEMSMQSVLHQTIIKIYDPKEISNTGDKLTCEGMARFQAKEDSLIEFFVEKDKDNDRFVGYEERVKAIVPPTATVEKAPAPIGQSRANPLPVGSTLQTDNGLEITVVSVDADAWPEIKAENEYNDPPETGKRFLVIRLEINNVSGGSEAISISTYDFELVGSSSLVISAGCGVVPDELQAEFYEGGEITGNVCFAVGNDEKEFILNYELWTMDKGHWLRLGNDADLPVTLESTQVPIAAPTSSGPKQYDSPPPVTIDPDRKYTATFQMAKGGSFVVELFAKDALKTVNNFVFLARDGFYDEVTFHRVIPGFMAQSGDPTGTGRGGPGYRFADEFSPALSHDGPGILSMAHAGGIDTNGSQFFITFVPTPGLDPFEADGSPKNCAQRGVSCHLVFGRVVEGMDVVNGVTARDPGSATTPGDVILSITVDESD